MIKLTSIQNKAFTRKFRGYDVKQVRQFLNTVSTRCAHLVHDNENLTNQNDEYRYKLNKFASLRKSLSTTMLEAQAAARQVKSLANKAATNKRKGADKYYKEQVASATQKANAILKRAVLINNTLVTKVNEIQKQAKALKEKIGDLLSKQANIFKTEDINDIINKPIGQKVNYNQLRKEVSRPSTVVFMPDGSCHKF